MLTKKRKTRKTRIRSRLSGTSGIPRLSVFRSSKKIYAQLIDDVKGVTLAQASGVDAKKVGVDIAALAKKAKISKVVFDRSGYRYHGRVKALAEAARDGGVKF